MSDFAAARAMMIESQVRTNDVSDLTLQTAMRAVAREAFVSADRRSFAYAEVTCPTPSGRDLWKPRDFAKLAQAAGVLPGDSVTVIGGAGGYSAAVFAAIGATVTIVDDREPAADAPLEGVTLVKGDLTAPPVSGQSVVFVDGAVEIIPEGWVSALAEGGRLCVVVSHGAVGKAQVHTRSGDALSSRVVFDAQVPALPGFEKAPVFSF